MKKGVLFLFILSAFVAIGQKQGKNKIDSLVLAYRPGETDSINLGTLYLISFEYHRVNPNKGIEYSQKLLAISNKLNLIKFKGDAYLSLGTNYSAIGDLAKALECELMALEIYEALTDTIWMAKAFNNIGLVYFTEGSLDKAIDYYKRALVLYKLKGITNSIGITLGNIGSVYQSLNNPQKAMDYFQQALSEFVSNKDHIGQARMFSNIGNLFDIQGNFIKALENKFKGLVIYFQIGDKNGLGRCYDNIAYTYYHIVVDSSKISFPDSLKDSRKNLQKAKEFEFMAYDIAVETENRYLFISAYSLLSQIESALGNYASALSYLHKLSGLQDSMFNSQNRQRMLDIENRKLESIRKKEIELKDIQLITAREKKMFLVFGITGLAIFLIVLLRYFFHQKSLNELLVIEKGKTDKLLLNILPEKVANELKNSGKTPASHFENVTVLFTDFVNFTGISESLSPSELVKEIHKYYSAFDTILERLGLEKIKTIGDAYMAVSGLPIEDEHHAFKAIIGAKEIRDYVKNSNGMFQIRIGLHSGPVVAGIVGVRKYAYDIWGDTVNTAARMEQKSEPGEINVSGTTFQLIKDKFDFEYRGKIYSKNKGEIDMYFLRDQE